MTRDIMQSISKSKLKSKLLELLRYVESEGEELIVTDRGKPVIKISKYYVVALSNIEKAAIITSDRQITSFYSQVIW